MKCVKIDDACGYDRAAEEMYQKSFQEVGARVLDMKKNCHSKHIHQRNRKGSKLNAPLNHFICDKSIDI